MRLTRIYFIALAFTFTGLLSSAHAQMDTQRVAKQFREYSLHESTDRGERLLDDVELPKSSVSAAMKLLAAMKEDGSWPDVDYASTARASWRPYDHLTRVLSLVVHARRRGTPAEEAAQCIAGAHRALAYWAQHDFQCPNWWYNEIGVPKILGNIAILMDADLSADERNYVTGTAMPRSKVGAMTGQNRVWLAGNGVMRGVLLDDEALVRKAAEVIRDEIRVSDGEEGIQPDWSFHQHGPQQQFGNYGMAYAVEMARWATVLRGTAFAIPEAKLAILRNYLLEGQNWVAWRGAFDISACGRQLFPDSPRSKVGVIRGAMRTMAVVDFEHAEDYRRYVARNIDGAENDLLGNRCFWRSDYVIHRRPDFCATLKMSSNRVIGGETVNSENLSGLLGADGATYLYRSGHEYDDIFPVWDWRKLPGITSVLNDAPLSWTKFDRTKSPAFVGGVSDGENGVAAMDFHRDALRAKKAWFFHGDVVVCLGTDVASDGKKPVVTTVNQCLLNGPVKVQRADKQIDFSGAVQAMRDVSWVEHDGLRYVFDEPASLSLEAEPRTGNWKKVFDTPATPKADVTKNVFTLCIEHGEPSYAYHILPADRAADAALAKVLGNSRRVQAVKVSEGWRGAVFWAAGSATIDGIPIEVDQPCVMMLVNVPDGFRVTLADPTHQLKNLNLSVDGESRKVELPPGGDAGKSVSVHIASGRK